MDELRDVVATRKVELQEEGVVKHTFNLYNIENWLDEGNLINEATPLIRALCQTTVSH